MSKYLSFEEESVTSIIKLSENIDEKSFKSFVNVSILALCGYEYNLNDINIKNDIDIKESIYYMGKLYWEIVKASPITNEGSADQVQIIDEAEKKEINEQDNKE